MTGAEPIVIAVDQGSSSTKALAVGAGGAVLGVGSVAVGESHPQPGWVEQDAGEITASLAAAVAGCLAGLDPQRVVAIGLSTQRESVVLWDRTTGVPVAPLVSWQDGRARELGERIRAGGSADLVERISGLPLDPMFSALKAAWLLDRYDPHRTRSRRGDLCLGTVDSWLTSTPEQHLIEIGHASRTQLLDLGTGQWSPELLEVFGVPEAVLPTVVASDGPFPALGARGPIGALGPIGPGVPTCAVLGDSHAALFGSGVRGPGPVKATYGTGSSVMTLVDAADVEAPGLGRTIAWQRGLERAGPAYALEGNIRATGATLMWLGRLLGATPDALAGLADGAESGGVCLVPAFGGLGAPWWDPAATGLLTGLTLATGPAQLARAALESIALQVNDVVRAAQAGGAEVTRLLADGGASSNDTLMQLQADLTAVPVERSTVANLSALGAAHLAGLAAGVWDDDTLAGRAHARDVFAPQLAAAARTEHLERWHHAVTQARTAHPPDSSPRSPS